MQNGLLALTGPPCSGKSSVAKLLAAGTSQGRRTYIEVDSLFSMLFPGSDRNRGDRMLAYDAAHAVARALLEHGQAAALECTYARFEQRLSMVKALADLPEAAIWLVEFYVTPEEAVARFKQRDQETDLDEQLLRERVAAFPYSAQALRLVSSEAGPADLATEIEAWLKSEPAPVQTDVWVQEGRGWD